MVLVSVIIPTLNEERYLPNLLESLSHQTFQDFEVIVSDSYSTDNTVKIAEEWGAKVVFGPKMGPGFARNLGAKEARGKFLAFFDADVVLKRVDTLEAMVNLLKNNPDVVGGMWRFKPLDGNFIDKALFEIAMILIYEFYLVEKYFFPGFSLFSRKDAFEEIGGFKEYLLPCEDWDLSERLSEIGRLKIIRDPPIWVSTRRTSNSSILDLIKYMKPGLYYLITKKNPKKVGRFVPMSEINGYVGKDKGRKMGEN